MSTQIPEEISLLDSLEGEWLKLPLTVMRDVGPAVQTLGGLLKITNRETFAETAKIADSARLPVKTVRNHLKTLHANDWIRNKGRQRTRQGFLRRTATFAITKRTRDGIEPYGILPWWACCSVKSHGRLSRGSKALLSVLMRHIAGIVVAVDEDNLDLDHPDDFAAAIEETSPERFALSLGKLAKETGLSRPTIVAAKRELHTTGIVKLAGNTPKDGEQESRELLGHSERRPPRSYRSGSGTSKSCGVSSGPRAKSAKL